MKTKSIACVAGLLLLVSPFRIFAQNGDLKSARNLTYCQKYEDAKKAFEALVQKEPTGENYFYKGENYIVEYLADTISVSLKDLGESTIPVFKKGIEVDSTSALNYVGLGRVSLLMNDKNEADKYFSKAKSFLAPYKKIKNIKDPKRYAYVLAKLAEAQIVRSRVDTSKALPLARQAQQIDPANPEIFIITGDIYMLISDASSAIKNYNKANDLDLKSPVAKVKIGNIYTRALNLQEAIKYFEEAKTIDANYAPAYRELGKLYTLAGQNEKAKANFKKYLELSGNSLPAKVEYVRALFQAKDYDECINQIEDILKLDKSRNYLRRVASICYYEKKNPDFVKSLSYIEDFFKNTTPDKIITRDYLYHGRTILKNKEGGQRTAIIDTLKLRGSYNMILRDYEATTAYDKKKKDRLKFKLDSVQGKIDVIVNKLKQDSVEIDKGFEKLNHAFSLDTTVTDVLTEIAFSYFTFKRYNDAVKIYSKVIAREPTDANSYLYLGRSYYQMKNYTKATEVFKKLTEIKSDFLPGYSWLANSFGGLETDTKQEGLAKPYYETLIEKANIDPGKNGQYLYDAYSYLYSNAYFSKDFDKDKCIEYANKMLTATPNKKDNKIRAYKFLATVYEKVKDYIKAKEQYQEILKLDPNDPDAKKRVDDLNKIIK